MRGQIKVDLIRIPLQSNFGEDVVVDYANRGRSQMSNCTAMQAEIAEHFKSLDGGFCDSFFGHSYSCHFAGSDRYYWLFLTFNIVIVHFRTILCQALVVKSCEFRSQIIVHQQFQK